MPTSGSLIANPSRGEKPFSNNIPAVPRKRFIVLGALNAVSKEVLTVTNEIYICPKHMSASIPFLS